MFVMHALPKADVHWLRLEAGEVNSFPAQPDPGWTMTGTFSMTHPSNKPLPLSSPPSSAWPLFDDQMLFTAWKSVMPLSAGDRPDV